MKSMGDIKLTKHVTRLPICSARYLLPGEHPHDDQAVVPSAAHRASFHKQFKANSVFKKVNKLGEKADIFAQAVFEHVRMGPKISETVKGKMRLGARIIRVGGVGKIFKRLFLVRDGEKLLKCSQCYLSTTAGPVAGLLFISTDKVAFCSERPIKCLSPDGMLFKYRYKVVIPIEKIKRVVQTEDAKKIYQKYIKIATLDNFEFWFMGFLNCDIALKSLQQVLYTTIDVKNKHLISESCMGL